MQCELATCALDLTGRINSLGTICANNLIVKSRTPIIDVTNRETWNHSEFHGLLNLFWMVHREMLNAKTAILWLRIVRQEFGITFEGLINGLITIRVG